MKKKNKTTCEYSGWIVAWIIGIMLCLVILDDIRLSKIVISQEKELEECNYDG